MRYQTQALVVAEAPFSESSQVVHLLTERTGFVAALVRGSYREKSSFGGALDVLTAGHADLTARRASDLELLHGFPLFRPWRGLRRTVPRWLGGACVLELLRPLSWPRERAGDLYGLAFATLEVLDGVESREEVDACLAYFAARLLALSGFRPQLDSCLSCGRALDDADAARFAPSRGGLLCEACARSDARSLPFSPAARSLLRRLLGEAPPRAAAASSEALREVRAVLDRFAEHRLERPLLAARWLECGIPGVP